MIQPFGSLSPNHLFGTESFGFWTIEVARSAKNANIYAIPLMGRVCRASFVGACMRLASVLGVQYQLPRSHTSMTSIILLARMAENTVVGVKP